MNRKYSSEQNRKSAHEKVCIVRCRRNDNHYAMKYTNKLKCIHDHAEHNVLREIDTLSALCHPIIVNLWYTFQVHFVLFPQNKLHFTSTGL